IPAHGHLGMVRCPGSFAIVLPPEWRFDGPHAGPDDTRVVSNPARRITRASDGDDRTGRAGSRGGASNGRLRGAEALSRQRAGRFDEIRVREGAVDAAECHRPAPQGRARARPAREWRVRRVRVVWPGHSHGPARRASLRHVLPELRLTPMTAARERRRPTVRNGYTTAVAVAVAVVALDALTKRWASATF